MDSKLKYDPLNGMLAWMFILGLGIGMLLQYLENSKLKENFENELSVSESKIDSLRGIIDSLNISLDHYAVIGGFTANITVYNGVPGQTDSTPEITADGTVFNPDSVTFRRYIALSRNFLTRYGGGPFRYGDFVLLQGCRYPELDGVYKVVDTMNSRHVNRGDILVDIGDEKLYPYQSRNVVVYRLVKKGLLSEAITAIM